MLKDGSLNGTNIFMELFIKNCNNIDSGKNEIANNKLNIKFGIIVLEKVQLQEL